MYKLGDACSACPPSYTCDDGLCAKSPEQPVVAASIVEEDPEQPELAASTAEEDPEPSTPTSEGFRHLRNISNPKISIF